MHWSRFSSPAILIPVDTFEGRRIVTTTSNVQERGPDSHDVTFYPRGGPYAHTDRGFWARFGLFCNFYRLDDRELMKLSEGASGYRFYSFFWNSSVDSYCPLSQPVGHDLRTYDGSDAKM